MSQGHLLLVDSGNSSLKFQLLRVDAEHLRSPLFLLDQLNAAPIHRISNEEATIAELLARWRQVQRPRPQDRGSSASGNPSTPETWQLAWTSVGPQAVQLAVRAAFFQLSGMVAPEPWRPSNRMGFAALGLGQFENHYENPEQLGADRWVSALGLAVLGAMAPGETHLVVSAGTATTFDVIRMTESPSAMRSAAFLGGWIIPGIGLMQQALRAHTRDLDGLMGEAHLQAGAEVDGEPPEGLTIGVPTQSRLAIAQGIGLAQTGFSDEIARRHHVTKLWLHGGHARQWRRYLSQRQAPEEFPSLTVHDAPHLAFAGLLALAHYRD